MKTMHRLALAAAAWLGAGASFAAPPANLAGTTWTVQANRSSEQLVISHQGGPGAPGAQTCRVIVATIGIAPVRGWYCAATGRIHLLHKNLDSGLTVRVFSGHVSDEVIGQPLYMAGTLAIHNAVFGDLGEYNFSAVN